MVRRAPATFLLPLLSSPKLLCTCGHATFIARKSHPGTAIQWRTLSDWCRPHCVARTPPITRTLLLTTIATNTSWRDKQEGGQRIPSNVSQRSRPAHTSNIGTDGTAVALWERGVKFLQDFKEAMVKGKYYNPGCGKHSRSCPQPMFLDGRPNVNVAEGSHENRVP